ncbi:MAG: translation elongation factor Ts [Gammaproteobacteria bacterium RIFCSPLOWO2_02_FULL_56_15]|nr:MAG: translation elongation factor Ts [Gammaproteobacteria bacterium RIFCSPLOWO2_02_FULL_56_15]
MQITASLVKELRERTGSGMMECKKALQETGGNIETAIEAMRKSGVAKAEKKAGRIAAEGIILIKQDAEANRAAIVEVNCETDFVAKDASFQGFAKRVADFVESMQPADLDELKKLAAGSDRTLEAERMELVARIGENISVRRFEVIHCKGDNMGIYLHGTRIGVLVDMDGGDPELAKDIAMHIAASRPVCVNEAGIPVDMLAREKDIYTVQAADSGKPAEIVKKMVNGRIRKFIGEITLLGQPFVKDPDQTVESVLRTNSAEVLGFVRYEVGEGIERKVDNFVEEVMAQAKS